MRAAPALISSETCYCRPPVWRCASGNF